MLMKQEETREAEGVYSELLELITSAMNIVNQLMDLIRGISTIYIFFHKKKVSPISLHLGLPLYRTDFCVCIFCVAIF